MTSPDDAAADREPSRFDATLAAFAQLTDQALLLVDPEAEQALMASPKALSLLQDSDDALILPAPLSALFETDVGLPTRLRLALATSRPIGFGMTLRGSAERVGVKAQRFDPGGAGPLVLVLFEAEPELQRRFRALNDRILRLNHEIENRREAERELSRTTAVLRRALAMVRTLSEIGTSDGEHLAVATEAVASSLGARDAVMLALAGRHLFCRAQTGSGLGRIDGAAPLDLAAHDLLPVWSARPAERDAMLLAALERAAGSAIDPASARVVPVTVLDAPVAALVAIFGAASPASDINSLEAGIVSEALGSLLVRADMEQRLIHGQKLEAIGRLTGGIAHDFNNILAVVLGNAELMLDEMTHGEDDLALAIQDAAQRGAILTSRLLSFARKQPLRPTSTDINALLRDIDPMIRRTIGAEIDLQLVTAGGLWNAVIDRSQLETALLNLVVNSRDALPGAGQVTIETGNARLDAEYAAQHDEVTPGQYVMVAVSDTGTGMDPATADQAFTPFFTTKEVGKGSGLGLSMVFGFVKQSGGHVKIYSEPGRGTTVRMYLPRVPEVPRSAGDDVVHAPDAADTGRGRILLVEDDPAVLRYTARTLGVLGYDVDPVLDGAGAIALLDREVYSLLLTDVVLPGRINGRMVAEHARRVAPDTAVLFMSGYTENAIVHHGRLDPDAELISKPFTRNQLAKKLKDPWARDADQGVTAPVRGHAVWRRMGSRWAGHPFPTCSAAPAATGRRARGSRRHSAGPTGPATSRRPMQGTAPSQRSACAMPPPARAWSPGAVESTFLSDAKCTGVPAMVRPRASRATGDSRDHPARVRARTRAASASICASPCRFFHRVDRHGEVARQGRAGRERATNRASGEFPTKAPAPPSTGNSAG